MRAEPAKHKKSTSAMKREELQNVVLSVTHILAIVIAFISVFAFLIKILYF
jgi:hypothetical protein